MDCIFYVFVSGELQTVIALATVHDKNRTHLVYLQSKRYNQGGVLTNDSGKSVLSETLWWNVTECYLNYSSTGCHGNKIKVGSDSFPKSVSIPFVNDANKF